MGRLLQCSDQPSISSLVKSWTGLSPWIAFWIWSTCTLVSCGMSSWIETPKPLISPFSCGMILLRTLAIGILIPRMYLMKNHKVVLVQYVPWSCNITCFWLLCDSLIGWKLCQLWCWGYTHFLLGKGTIPLGWGLSASFPWCYVLY